MASWHFDEVRERIMSIQLHDDMLSYLSCDSLSVSSLTQSSAQRQVVERLVNILHHVVMSVNMSGRAGEVFSRHDAVEILHRLRDVDELTVCDFTLTPTGWHKNAPPCTRPTYSLCLSLHKNVAHFVNYF